MTSMVMAAARLVVRLYPARFRPDLTAMLRAGGRSQAGACPWT